MRSRASMLLEREYLKLQTSPFIGISASPQDNNLLEWTATIQGLKGTPWEGGLYQLSLNFTEEYNSVPPTVTFPTVPFHPNVDKATGRPCIGFLDNPRKWKQSLTVSSVLLNLQVMLSNPVVERAVNTEAAAMLRFDPARYWATVHDCKPDVYNPAVVGCSALQAPHSVMGRRKRIQKVPFNDYLRTWSGIATSRASSRNSLLDSLQFYPSFQKMHYRLMQEIPEKGIEAQNEEFNAIMFGRFGKLRKANPIVDEKLARIGHMKHIYIQGIPDNCSPVPTQASFSVHSEVSEPSRGEDEEWEREVDNLVAWTSQLDSNELEKS